MGVWDGCRCVSGYIREKGFKFLIRRRPVWCFTQGYARGHPSQYVLQVLHVPVALKVKPLARAVLAAFLEELVHSRFHLVCVVKRRGEQEGDSLGVAGLQFRHAKFRMHRHSNLEFSGGPAPHNVDVGYGFRGFGFGWHVCEGEMGRPGLYSELQ